MSVEVRREGQRPVCTKGEEKLETHRTNKSFAKFFRKVLRRIGSRKVVLFFFNMREITCFYIYLGKIFQHREK